jgi:hypothetical protein
MHIEATLTIIGQQHLKEEFLVHPNVNISFAKPDFEMS